MSGRDRSTHVAIVGMAGRFPGADSVDAFWQNLVGGVESITRFSDDELAAAGVPAATLADPRYVRARAAMDGADLFDAALFGLSQREAQITDPQHRLMLELAWHALEDAGCDPERFPGAIGVYGSVSWSSYLFQLLARPDLTAGLDGHQIMFGNDKDYFATRVAYKLGLRGPAVVVQSACSSSLVAAHAAYQGLLAGECDLALAGGVTVMMPRAQGYHVKPGTVSADGHCRPFSRGGDGTVPGDGAGVIAMKRFEDAVADGSTIHAVIIGSAVNNDGGRKVGYTAPSVEGQLDVIQAALVVAQCDGADVTYVEAHGTGTRLGDPIEVAALARAYGREGGVTGSCGIGSLKSNVGHMDAAAGIGGLIKLACSLRERELAPTLNFLGPNPELDLSAGPFHIVTERRPWDTDRLPRRGAVTSLGVGGTNAHVILEEPPPPLPAAEAAGPQLLVWSAASPGAADAYTASLAAHFARAATDPADAAFTLQVGRRQLAHRRALVVSDPTEAAHLLGGLGERRPLAGRAEVKNPPVVFVFPGQGAQHVDMGRELYARFPRYRACFDRGAELLRPILDLDLRELVFPPAGRREAAEVQLARTTFSQPALFLVEYAMAELWRSLGVEPAALLGHSLGEYVAACVAGVLRLEDALAVVSARGRLVEQLPPGAMLIVPLPEHELRRHLSANVYLAAINAPELSLASGHDADIAELEVRLRGAGVETRRVRAVAPGHSPLIDPILDEFSTILGGVRLGRPAIPIASSRTGAFVGDEDMARIDYWRAHFREPVRFSDAVRTLLQDPVRVFLEVGPGTTAATLVRKHVARPGERAVIASGRSAKDPRGELEVFLEALGGMWLAGVEPRWGELHPEARRRVRLPLYALERRRYGINGGVDLFSLGAGGGRAAAGTREGELPSREPPAGANAPGRTATAPRDDLERRVGAIWQRLLGVAQLDVHADFFAEGGDSFQAMQLIAEVSRELGTSLGPEALAGASTVAGMAQRLRALADEGARPSAHLVALAGAGPAAPVFLVHPVGGTVFIYRELAAALAPRPVYGLQASGLVGGPLPGSVSEMAAAYLSELAAVAPRGPLVLIGASAGGAIAYEMARQAGAAGRTVALVGLLDTPGPADVADVFADDAERIYYAVGDRLGMPLDELRGRSLDEQLARALVALAPGAPVDLERGRRLLAVFQAIERAFLDYAAPPLDLPVVYVRARARRPRWDPERPEAYWIERARAGLEIHVVEGDHISILHGPHVAALAGRLTGAIDRALRTP